MANKQLIIPGNRAFNSDGLPIAGAQLKLFTTGTTTPANFYADSGLVTPLGPTLTANGAGRFTASYQNEATPFRLQVLDAAGTVLDDIDPFYFGASTDAAVAAATATTQAGIATTQAGTATTQAGIATTQAGIATTGASTATTQAGIATTGGATATTQAGIATTQATAAAASAVTAASYAGVITLTKPYGSYAGGLVDSRGRYFALVKTDGSLLFSGVTATQGTFTTATLGTASVASGAPYGYSWAFTDTRGRAVAGVKNDGTFGIAKLSAALINGVSAAAITTAANPYGSQKPVLDAEINLYVGYGQSRAAGTLAVPVLTTAQLYDGLRFSDGVRPYDTATPLRNSLVALIETDNGAAGSSEQGETPASGTEATIKQRLVTENGIAYTDRPYQMLMTVEGTPGSPVANLAVGTGPYNAIKADFDAMRTLAQAAGKSSKFRCITCSQGEGDYQLSTPAATWRAGWTAIRSGLDTYANSGSTNANPKNGTVYCFMDQVFAHSTYGYPNNPYLALEQLAMSEDTPGFVMVGSVAHVPRADGVHPTNIGAQLMGALFARAYKRVVIEQGVWQPLKPVDWYRDGKVVWLRFNPESGQLAFDTSTVAAQANMGFTLADSGGTAITINSVAIVGKDTIKITAATTVGANAVVRGGFGAGGYTNLRDTMGDTITSTIGANTYALHNWCVIFQKTLS